MAADGRCATEMITGLIEDRAAGDLDGVRQAVLCAKTLKCLLITRGTGGACQNRQGERVVHMSLRQAHGGLKKILSHPVRWILQYVIEVKYMLICNINGDGRVLKSRTFQSNQAVQS